MEPPAADSAAAAATPEEVVKHLVELSHRGSEPIPNSDVLFSALAVVSRCYSVPVPSHSAGAIADALRQVRHMMQQHRLFAEIDPKYEYTAMQRATIEVGLRTLWAHVTTYQLHNALIDTVRTIDPLPRAIMYWKKLRKRHVRATLQDGPMEWFLPSSERITIDEKIRSLEATLEEHLVTQDMQEGLRLLELVYSTSGIIPPRKGEGTFMKMDPLPFVAIEFADSIFPEDHDGIVLAEDVLGSFQRLEENLNRFKRAQEQFVSCLTFAMTPCLPPSKLRQRWLHVTIAALCVTTGGIWVFNNQKEFQAAATTFRTALQEFLNEHMIEPIHGFVWMYRAIVGEVILNQKPEIQDPGALLDTKLSLQRMLSDFVKDTNPSVSKEELQRVMDEMDMSVVSLQYEKQLASAVRNLMSGDIVRMLLIQVQFIKKELMVAMGAIDELMHANQLNLQIMATVPTFIVFGGVYTLAKNVFAYIYKRTSERLFYDPSEIAGFLRNNLRDIERLLNKQNRSSNGQQDEVLGVRDLGFLILLLHQLRDIFESYKSFFQEEEQERFEEDLNDLIEEGLLVSQQLAVIQRMYHSHPFLYTNTKATARSLLS
ncbi:Nuclear control of atpase protein 2, partial [Globisporangium splendens]